MAEQALSATAPAAPKPKAETRREASSLVPRLITGAVILGLWESVVRGFAPGYVAKPSSIVLAIPRVIVDPTFLTALGQTLAAVAEGLAITLVLGSGIGILMGRSPLVDRMIRVYVNGFNALPMIIVLPASMPYLLAGFRLAAGRALIGAVVAEFFLSIGGLGFYILYNSRSYHHNEAFVGVLLLAAFGVGFEVLVQWATRRFMPWYRRGEK